MSVVQGFALSIYFWGGMSSGRELELEQGPFEDPRLPGNNESLATLHFHYLGSAGRWNRPPPPPIGPHPIPSDARSHRVFPPLRHLNLRCSGFPCPEAMKILTKKTTRSHLLEPSAPPPFWFFGGTGTGTGPGTPDSLGPKQVHNSGGGAGSGRKVNEAAMMTM